MERNNHLNYLRNPAFISVAVFNENQEQRIEFSHPKEILNTLGIAITLKWLEEVATSLSLIEEGGRRMLWYPDRKHYLLGVELPDLLLNDMRPIK